jgi:glutamate-1-semialdehyde 2,1-aminomutase
MVHRKGPLAAGVSGNPTARSATAPGDGLTRLLGEYEASTGASRAFHERIGRSLAGGETRFATFYEPYPFAVARAGGARLVDLDGNEYLDLNNNMAALVHGHGYPPIIAAVAESWSELGSVQAGSHHVQLEFAELLVDRFPGLERIRFTNSGSEAATLALRVARRATGRERVLMFEGAYHGMGAEFSDVRPDVVRVPFNDVDAVAAALDDTVAAVFAESFLGHGGVIPAERGFLEALVGLAHDGGSLFVLDEVQSMRNDYRGHHGALGIVPDLVVMGKSLGGGLPIGLLGGRRELVEIASVARPDGIHHSGTFNGNVLTCAAGLACLRALGQDQIASLNDRSQCLATRLEAAARDMRVPLVVTRSGSTLCLHFLEHVPRDARQATPYTEHARWIHIAALLEGVFVIRGGRLNLSTALTEQDLSRVEEALVRAIGRLGEIFEPHGDG